MTDIAIQPYARGEMVALVMRHSYDTQKAGRIYYERLQLAQVASVSRDKQAIRAVTLRQYGHDYPRDFGSMVPAPRQIMRIGAEKQEAARLAFAAAECSEFADIDAARAAILAEQVAA